ncbi:MAG TPA: hypothetical protein V6D50_06120 [Chroococcales cyanobacterium]
MTKVQGGDLNPSHYLPYWMGFITREAITLSQPCHWLAKMKYVRERCNRTSLSSSACIRDRFDDGQHQLCLFPPAS